MSNQKEILEEFIDEKGRTLNVRWWVNDDGATSCGIEWWNHEHEYECDAGSSLDWALSHGGIQCDDVFNENTNYDAVIPIDEETLKEIENFRDECDKQLNK